MTFIRAFFRNVAAGADALWSFITWQPARAERESPSLAPSLNSAASVASSTVLRILPPVNFVCLLGKHRISDAQMEGLVRPV